MPEIRDADPTADALACAEIYRPYVLDSVITFEDVPPTEDDMAGRIAAAQQRHAWLVAEVEGAVVGYAYAGVFKARTAYDWSCEVSVYLAQEARGRGLGKTLYLALFDRLDQLGYRMACACVTVPNPASVALHRRLGFTEVGTFRRIGWKFDAWHDVAWFQMPLGDGAANAR